MAGAVAPRIVGDGSGCISIAERGGICAVAASAGRLRPGQAAQKVQQPGAAGAAAEGAVAAILLLLVVCFRMAAAAGLRGIQAIQKVQQAGVSHNSAVLGAKVAYPGAFLSAVIMCRPVNLPLASPRAHSL
jgi:hypothetical protein